MLDSFKQKPKGLDISIPLEVALRTCTSYKSHHVNNAVTDLFDALKFTIKPSDRVLVKPNLVTSSDPLATTEPELVKTVCTLLIEMGASVTVGDSPAFGSARKVAQKSGIAKAIKGLDLKFVELDTPVAIKLSSGITLGISKKAIEQDIILNLPRLKAHCQTGITAGVKNLFGCVCGFRKAFLHFRYGDVGTMFEDLIIEIPEVLPPAFTIVDAITVMDTTGPSGGRACRLGILGGSWSPFALDTALYHTLGADIKLLPLQRVATQRNIPGTSITDLRFPLSSPDFFDCSAFKMPSSLQPLTFQPAQIIWGRFKSLVMRIF